MTTVAAYNFNNVAEEAGTVYDDAAGHYHNGSVVGTVPRYNSPIGQKLRYLDNNAANYISIPHHADFKIDTDWTIEAWWTPLTVGDAAHKPLTKGITGGPYLNWGVNLGDQKTFIGVYTDASNYIGVSSPAVVVANRLYHMAFTFDRTAKKLLMYQHGTCVAQGTETGTYTGGDDSGTLRLSGTRDNLYPASNYLHNLQWSNRVRTPKEIYDRFLGTNVRES